MAGLIRGKTMHIIKTDTDKEECCISSICEANQGKLFVLDWRNQKVKLMDSTYNVVYEIKLDGKPHSMCSINSRKVAVTAVESKLIWGEDGRVKDRINRFRIYFIKKTNDKLAKCRTLKFGIECRGIAHHQGKLYITSGTALYSYRYTVDGTRLKTLYERPSGKATVTSVAVSRDGARIYVVNQFHNMLLTLSRTGKVISILHGRYPEGGEKCPRRFDWRYTRWEAMPGLHVTDTGQILVCGGKIDKILVIDSDGQTILNERDTKEHGVCKPRSVYYSTKTGSLIVGVWKNDIFFVYPSFLYM